METTFTPMVIGSPDAKKEKEVINFYAELCEQASCLLYNLELYLECMDNLEISDLFGFINSQNPREFLYLKWMQIKNIEIPLGLSIDKAIELDLIDVPRDEFSNLLEQRKKLLEFLKKAKEEIRFFYPLNKLFDNRTDFRGFSFSAIDQNGFESKEFDQALYNHVRTFTKSERENQVLEKIQKFVDILNELAEIGVVLPVKGKWEDTLEKNIISNLICTPGESNPFSLNKIIFRRLVLKKDLLSVERVSDDKSFRYVTSHGEFKDILSFVSGDQPEC